MAARPVALLIGAAMALLGLRGIWPDEGECGASSRTDAW